MTTVVVQTTAGPTVEIAGPGVGSVDLPLGSANNPVTDAAAVRPNLPVVWWKTSTIPANAEAGDIRIAV